MDTREFDLVVIGAGKYRHRLKDFYSYAIANLRVCNRDIWYCCIEVLPRCSPRMSFGSIRARHMSWWIMGLK